MSIQNLPLKRLTPVSKGMSKYFPQVFYKQVDRLIDVDGGMFRGPIGLFPRINCVHGGYCDACKRAFDDVSSILGDEDFVNPGITCSRSKFVELFGQHLEYCKDFLGVRGVSYLPANLWKVLERHSLQYLVAGLNTGTAMVVLSKTMESASVLAELEPCDNSVFLKQRNTPYFIIYRGRKTQVNRAADRKSVV